MSTAVREAVRKSEERTTKLMNQPMLEHLIINRGKECIAGKIISPIARQLFADAFTKKFGAIFFGYLPPSFAKSVFSIAYKEGRTKIDTWLLSLATYGELTKKVREETKTMAKIMSSLFQIACIVIPSFDPRTELSISPPEINRIFNISTLIIEELLHSGKRLKEILPDGEIMNMMKSYVSILPFLSIEEKDEKLLSCKLKKKINLCCGNSSRINGNPEGYLIPMIIASEMTKSHSLMKKYLSVEMKKTFLYLLTHGYHLFMISTMVDDEKEEIKLNKSDKKSDVSCKEIVSTLAKKVLEIESLEERIKLVNDIALILQKRGLLKHSYSIELLKSCESLIAPSTPTILGCKSLGNKRR